MSRHAPLIDEARTFIDRAIAGLNTLHLGPLDYNISTTVDDLRTAERLIEEYGSRASATVSIAEPSR